jgi:hypothetical protein
MIVGYKSAGDYIVKLSINKTTSNINRKNVYDINTAYFRCKEAKVESITHKISNKKIDIVKSDYDSSFIYETHKTVTAKNYNTDKDSVCTGGIHFFLTEEPAKYYNFNTTNNFTGILKTWYSNGFKNIFSEYNRGKFIKSV